MLPKFCLCFAFVLPMMCIFLLMCCLCSAYCFAYVLHVIGICFAYDLPVLRMICVRFAYVLHLFCLWFVYQYCMFCLSPQRSAQHSPQPSPQLSPQPSPQLSPQHIECRQSCIVPPATALPAAPAPASGLESWGPRDAGGARRVGCV